MKKKRKSSGEKWKAGHPKNGKDSCWMITVALQDGNYHNFYSYDWKDRDKKRCPNKDPQFGLAGLRRRVMPKRHTWGYPKYINLTNLDTGLIVETFSTRLGAWQPVTDQDFYLKKQSKLVLWVCFHPAYQEYRINEGLKPNIYIYSNEPTDSPDPMQSALESLWGLYDKMTQENIQKTKIYTNDQANKLVGFFQPTGFTEWVNH